MTDVDIRQKDVEATRENHNPETNRNLELKTLNGPTRQSRDDNLLTTRESTPDRRDSDFALKSNTQKKSTFHNLDHKYNYNSIGKFSRIYFNFTPKICLAHKFLF